MKKNVTFNVFMMILIVSIFNAINAFGQIMDELNGSTLGNAYGITYTATPNGQGAVFQRSMESRIEYPFAKGLPHEGTIEMLIKVTKAYSYYNYVLNDNINYAYIFTTNSADVWYKGAMWFVGYNNGDVTLQTALTSTPTSHSLSATGTSFRYNEWHVVSFSYGSQGQYICIDGQIVASNPSYTETLQTCGNGSGNYDQPIIGETHSVKWQNNQYESGIEGVLDRFRASTKQQDWVLFQKTKTNAATNIGSNSATLNGTVYPNGLSTTVSFEYGLTTSYGNTIAAKESPVSGNASVAVSADLTNLTTGATYHFRVKAVNSNGTTYGDDMSFTTLDPLKDGLVAYYPFNKIFVKERTNRCVLFSV